MRLMRLCILVTFLCRLFLIKSSQQPMVTVYFFFRTKLVTAFQIHVSLSKYQRRINIVYKKIKLLDILAFYLKQTYKYLSRTT